MPKSLKKIKNFLPKTIKMYSVALTDQEYTVLDPLCINYGRCRGRLFNELCGIKSMERVDNARNLRNSIRKQNKDIEFVQTYHFLKRHWVESLFDTCANVNSMWSNTANKIRKIIQNNDLLDENERHYLYFILCFKELWSGVLNYHRHAYLELSKKFQKSYLDVRKPLSDKQLHHADNYLRRLTRRYKAYPHKISQHNRSMTYDESMYSFKDDTTISIASNKPKQRILLKLTGYWRYAKKGNVQIVLNRDKHCIEIHKLIKTHKRKLKTLGTIGIDKGLYTLLSCSTENEYGIGFSKLSNKESDRLCNVNSRRNKYRVKDQKLGSKHYHKTRDQHKEYMKAEINHAVLQMILTEKPTKIIKEDLTFTKEKLPKAKNKAVAKQRRRLSSWAKGYLNERIEYICNKYQIDYQDINPAYTSQYCPCCGNKFIRRYGKHHELVECPRCGEMNANIGAAKNIRNRENDPEINLYTPYKKVKEILDSRI